MNLINEKTRKPTKEYLRLADTPSAIRQFVHRNQSCMLDAGQTLLPPSDQEVCHCHRHYINHHSLAFIFNNLQCDF